MKKERLARGWTLRDLSANTGVNFSHLGRIENGHRPPTETVARACDRVFPERKGWFVEYYQESRTWMPLGFRDWPEIENKATRLSEWSPQVMTGQMQHLADVARLPNVTLQILPAVAHPATQSGFVIADSAAYTEHVVSGLVFGNETVTSLERLFDTLRAECYRASESAAIIGKAAALWTGESRATAEPTAATA